jgi:hypothetical protein
MYEHASQPSVLKRRRTARFACRFAPASTLSYSVRVPHLLSSWTCSKPPVTNAVTARGQTFRIFFMHNLGARARVAIDISPDDGRVWNALATAPTGSTTSSYNGTIDPAGTKRAQIRVRALDGGGVVGLSPLFLIQERPSFVER